jgi:hypothetical protein
LIGGLQVISPWSDVKFFNTPDFDPSTGIYTPTPGAFESGTVDKGLEHSGAIEIFPNPSEGLMLNVRLENFDTISGITNVIVRDMTGKVVHQEQLQLDDKKGIFILRFNTELSPGIYILEAFQSELWEYERFIVK